MLHCAVQGGGAAVDALQYSILPCVLPCGLGNVDPGCAMRWTVSSYLDPFAGVTWQIGRGGLALQRRWPAAPEIHYTINPIVTVHC